MIVSTCTTGNHGKYLPPDTETSFEKIDKKILNRF